MDGNVPGASVTYPLQHPGTKLFTAAVVWGVCTGTGKSFVGDLLRDIYGPNAVEFYAKLRAWRFGGGPSALFDYFLKLDLGDFHPHAAAPVTPAKEEMLRSAKSDVGRWVRDLRETGQAPGLKPDCELFTPAEVLHGYEYTLEQAGRVSENRVGLEMQKARFARRRVRVGDKTLRLYAVRNHEKWRDADDHEWTEHRKNHGPKNAGSNKRDKFA